MENKTLNPRDDGIVHINVHVIIKDQDNKCLSLYFINKNASHI